MNMNKMKNTNKKILDVLSRIGCWKWVYLCHMQLYRIVRKKKRWDIFDSCNKDLSEEKNGTPGGSTLELF
jgi:hypothetical protein